MITGNDIKAERIKQGLSQKTLAELIGYKSGSIISKAENDELDEEKMEMVAKALNMNTDKRPPKFTIYTDGGCEVNPGGRGGYGIVICDDNTGKTTEISSGYRSSTNNRMEIMAAIVACGVLPEGAEAVLYSDSQYLVNTMTKGWKMNKNKDLWKRLLAVVKGKKIHFAWVRGHNGDENNERCDNLAMEAYLSPSLLADKGYEEEQKVQQGLFA